MHYTQVSIPVLYSSDNPIKELYLYCIHYTVYLSDYPCTLFKWLSYQGNIIVLYTLYSVLKWLSLYFIQVTILSRKYIWTVYSVLKWLTLYFIQVTILSRKYICTVYSVLKCPCTVLKKYCQNLSVVQEENDNIFFLVTR